VSWAVLLPVALLTASSGELAAGDRPETPADQCTIESICISADGKHVAAFAPRKRWGWLRLIDTETSQERDVRTPLDSVWTGAFIDGGRACLLSGWSRPAGDAKEGCVTCVYRMTDGADLCRPATSATTGLRELASLYVVPSSDGEALATIAGESKTIEIRRADTGRVRATIQVDEKLRKVLWFDGRSDLLVLLDDDRLARIAAADGKVVWRAEVPRRGDGTTWLPGERVIPPFRPSVFIQPPGVTVDGSRALVVMRERDETGWSQRVVVAYDWSNGRESWREKPDDDVMGEVFFVPKLRLVGLSYARAARFHSYDTGELVASVALEQAPRCVAFPASSAMGWAGGYRGAVFAIDAGAAEPK